jgi:hypothetical protein
MGADDVHRVWNLRHGAAGDLGRADASRAHEALLERRYWRCHRGPDPRDAASGLHRRHTGRRKNNEACHPYLTRDFVRREGIDEAVGGVHQDHADSEVS